MNTVQFKFSAQRINLMKKIFLPLMFLPLILPGLTNAQISHDMLLDSEAIAAAGPSEDAVAQAEESARKLLQQKPQSLRKQTFPKLRSHPAAEPAKVVARSQSAPFGLVWGATVAATRNQGITLTDIDESNYQNNFNATHLPKPLQDITQVDLTFGIEDELWRILAYGKRLDDDASASKVMKMYQTYAGLLEQKYGHKQEFFTPATISVTKQNAQGKNYTVQEQAPLGNPDFLQQLQSGAATLYSTYYNQEVGAALAVNVDGDGKSYIVIDYKNLPILQAREKETLDAL